MEKPNILRSRHAFNGSVVGLRVDEVRYPDGHVTTREVVEHPGGGVVVPVLDDGRIMLVRQYRHPAVGFVYELPAGKLEKGESPESCALRELEEETGHTTSSLTKLASIYTSPGFCDEILHIYLAERCTPLPGGQRLDPGESLLSLHPASIAEIHGMIDRGALQDGKTLAGIFLALRTLGALS